MFETAHLILRAYRKSDEDALHDSWNTYAVQVLATTGYVVPKPDSFKASAEWWLSQALIFVVVEDKESGKFVGRASLRGATPRNRDAEVAISLSPEWWGKGYGTEIMTWLVDYGFRGLGLHRLSLSATSNNERALALYKKVGFVEEIVRKKAAWIEGRWVDVVEMGIVEDDFVTRHAQTAALEPKEV
ncbi:acyl-CoA N-acyltransferase [Dentipellis sp. KUC8613]|nr:acyl-CoA N-acyltransferase [Dentipellis sp. KUC8613]